MDIVISDKRDAENFAAILQEFGVSESHLVEAACARRFHRERYFRAQAADLAPSPSPESDKAAA